VSLILHKGQSLAVVGGSGSGKSTLAAGRLRWASRHSPAMAIPWTKTLFEAHRKLFCIQSRRRPTMARQS
jgi:ABC-type glutathione transport system ATPase component